MKKVAAKIKLQDSIDSLFLGRAYSVSSATLISRILGYTRDMLIANFFGATMAADAFFVAYRIPNLLRRLLGEGSLSTSFIPVFTSYLNKNSKDDQNEFIKSIFGAFGLIFVLLTFIGIIFAPFIVKLIAWGYTADTEKFVLTVHLTRIMFPFLMAIGLAAICLGVLNSYKLFFVPAVAPVMLSISQIIVMLFICPLLELPITGLAYGVLVGGFLQFFFQFIPAAGKTGLIIPRINFLHPGVKRVFTLMAPAVVGISIVQINSFVDTICATMLKEGSVTHLYYANRLMQLPLALFGTAIATVALPMMSDNASASDKEGIHDTFVFSLKMISFLILPATAVLLFFQKPLIALLFERGAFSSYDTVTTSSVLVFYAAGLIFFSWIKLTASAFYSMQDTKTPMITACIAMLINVILNILVVKVDVLRAALGAGGLALATSISAAVNLMLLFIYFASKTDKADYRSLFKSISKHITAAVFMSLSMIYMSRFTADMFLFGKVLTVLTISSLVYIVMSYLLKVKELYILFNRLGR